MNKKQQMYETPVTDITLVNTEEDLLQGSIKASRDSYGTAQTDEWD